MRLSTPSFVALALVLAACSGGSSDAGSDASATDTATAADVITTDDTAAIDASSPDAIDAATDSFTMDAAIDAPPATDAIADTARTDASSPSDVTSTSDAEPNPACMYFPADEVIARCGDRFLMISRVLPGEGAPSSCQPYFAAGEGRYGSQEEALRGAMCDTRCLYRFATSVTRLYCGRRSGYETLAADGCPGIIRFAEGYFSSVEEHDTMHPCPDE